MVKQMFEHPNVSCGVCASCSALRLHSVIFTSTEVLVCEKLNIGQTKGPHWLMSSFLAQPATACTAETRTRTSMQQYFCNRLIKGV